MAANAPGSEPGLGHGSESLSLATFYQQQYRETFQAALAAGKVKPLVIPWSFIGSFYLPLLYLSIPHTKRPWLYRMRWLVAAVCVYLNVCAMQTTSASNEAVGYVVGCATTWGIIWSLRNLLFTRPQWEAARVVRRPRTSPEKQNLAAAPDESVAAALPHYGYYWQPFPADAPFTTRFAWTADLLTSLRGVGWNHPISAIPHPPFHHPSSSSHATVPVHLDRIPLASRTGSFRSRTYHSFLRSRLTHLALSWLIIDFLTITMRQDPYFLLGPDHDPLLPLPAFLTALPFPNITISLVRNLAALAGTVSGLHLYAAAAQLLACCVPPFPQLLGVGAELWQHPTLFGGFAANVLDRGLAGFWGGWWHQTFREGFVAPARWLVPKGNKVARAVVQTMCAFLLSGALHAAGGYTSIRSGTVAWTPVVFFLLQGAGILLQAGVCALVKRYVDVEKLVSKKWRRVGNLVFVAGWLHFTAWGLIDDMSRAGLWLFEPAPASPLRLMRFGAPGEPWWRWGGRNGLRWYTGRHWWESGFALEIELE